MIPYGKQDISQQDIDSVIEVLKSDFLTQGPKVPYFEDTLNSVTGAKKALAFNSATSALHAACLSLGLGRGDYLWTSPITFVASANAGLYCGSRVDFVDIDPDTYNLCPDRLEEKLKRADKKGLLPKIVMPVHLSGQSCDMEAIKALSNKYGFKIIEDASHAIGGSYKSKFIGDCKYSDITVFSFHPVKIITTAEGGAALTNDIGLYDKMNLYRSHGITRNKEMMTEESHGPWYYQQLELGYNYRMNELQAALGISQISRLKEFVNRRHELARKYNESLVDLPLKLPTQLSDSFSSFHLYIIRIKLTEVKKSHLQIFEELRNSGIAVNIHYIPVHLQPYYKKLGFRKGDFPESERYYSEAISIPLYPNLTPEDQIKVINSLAVALDK